MIHIHKKDQQDAPLSLNNLFQLIYRLHASNKQVHHREVISVHTAYIISVYTAYIISVHTAYIISVHTAYIISVHTAYIISHVSLGV